MEGDNPPVTQVYVPPRTAIMRLGEAGLVRGLDGPKLDALRAECWDDDEDQMDEVGVLGILTMYYETVDKGVRDGFLWHDDRFWMETEDVIAELAAMLRDDRPLFRQLAIEEQVAHGAQSRETIQKIDLERDDGAKKEILARGLDDVVACFNDELRARGRQKRIIPLETSGEWKMYVAAELRLIRKLVSEGVLPVSNLDSLRD